MLLCWCCKASASKPCKGKGASPSQAPNRCRAIIPPGDVASPCQA
nr:MAG TPA: hypothetical protein [Caudoviricetes sp.]